MATELEKKGDAPDPTGGVDPTSSSDFLSTLQNKLSAQGEIVSSASTGVEKAISGAIESTRKGTEAETARIESQFGRALTEEAGTGRDRIQNAVESRGGFATQLTGLRRLVETTDKNLKDLEQRKQELILQNNASGAAKISELQLDALKFKQDAEQNVFNNLLSQSSFGLQAASFEEQKRQADRTFEFEGEKFEFAKENQSFVEDQAIGAIALEFGLQVGEDETIDSVISRAQQTGIVDERRALELEQLRSSINASNATAAKALQGISDNKAFDDQTAEILAKSVVNGDVAVEDLIGGLTSTQRGQILGAMNTVREQGKEALTQIASGASSVEEFRRLAEASDIPFTQAQVDAVAEAMLVSGVGGKPKGKMETSGTSGRAHTTPEQRRRAELGSEEEQLAQLRGEKNVNTVFGLDLNTEL